MSDTQTDVRYATPQEWVDFLKTPGLKKYQTQFADPVDTEARCCLGHYCVLNGWLLDPDLGQFDEQYPEDSGEPVRAHLRGVVLPDGHWLFKRAPVKAFGGALTAVDHIRDGYNPTHQANLVAINDGTDGFGEVISYIETYIIGAQS